MQALLKQAADHWRYVAPLLRKLENEADYDAKVEALDDILEIVGDNEDHPLASLAVELGDVIEAYDEAMRPMPEASHADVLRHLMEEHGIKQSELPEVGAQSVVSFVLSGKRILNWGQICALSERFGISTDSFRLPKRRIVT